MAQRPKFAKSSVDAETSHGEITFIAARNVRNLNGFEYQTATLLAQDASGEYSTLGTDWQDVSIPLMQNHSGQAEHKIGNIYTARLVTIGEEQHVEMKAKFFKGDIAQEVRQRVLDGELTDVSITTDWGDGDVEEDTLSNAHIIEVSVVYAGAEPKAKILASNSVTVTIEADEGEDVKVDIVEPQEDEIEETDEVEEPTNNVEPEKQVDETKEEKDMASQPTNAPVTTDEKVATKAQVMNSLTKLAKSGAIRGMTRNQVIEAVKNEVTLLDTDGTTAYVVPDAVFGEILAEARSTDILQTFDTIPARRFTLMSEVPSDADLARAGRWSKGEKKQIQESDLRAQKLETQFIYKMQELSYEDMQDDFGDILYAYIRKELPQKLDEEEERAFIVGDGRTAGPRKITSIVSLDAAAEDVTNVHVAKYDGSTDANALEAIMKGIEKLEVEGELHLVSNGSAIGRIRRGGLAAANGLPFNNATIADALGVDGLHKRKYVGDNVVYVWTRNYVKRLTGPTDNIEQYDIDYNNQKIEYIRPAGGAAVGLYSAVKIVLPAAV